MIKTQTLENNPLYITVHGARPTHFLREKPWGRGCVTVACSQTLYFLFKVRRARVIKYKPQGIY